MSKHIVGTKEELKKGNHLVVQVKGRELGIFEKDGEYKAFLNWCAHQSGPICEGHLEGTVEASYDSDIMETTLEYCREGEILHCPWHGWEYDITSGECLSRKGVTLPSYPVTVEGDNIVVEI
jgi:nitrite reductase (NADH) small subunit